MELSKLIDRTTLNVMGHILNAIQDSAARSVGYGEAEGEDEVGVEGEGEVEEEVSDMGRGRKKDREGAKCKKTTDKDNNHRTCQISKRKKTTKKKGHM